MLDNSTLKLLFWQLARQRNPLFQIITSDQGPTADATQLPHVGSGALRASIEVKFITTHHVPRT